MKLVAALLLCSFALKGSESSIQNPVYVGIVGGRDTGPRDHPYICSLQIWYGKNWTHDCGAVIWNRYYIVTAAHCVEDGYGHRTSARAFRVKCGIRNIDGNNQRLRKVVTVIPHENFEKGHGKYPNDIAVLRLRKPLVFTGTIRADDFAKPSDGDFAGETCTISGWGRLSGGGPSPTTLQEAETRVLTNSVCGEISDMVYQEINSINDGHICGGGRVVSSGTCDGDSGGPMRCGNKIVGLTSWGPEGCVVWIPDVYTRVSHFHDWLVSKAGPQ